VQVRVLAFSVRSGPGIVVSGRRSSDAESMSSSRRPRHRPAPTGPLVNRADGADRLLRRSPREGRRRRRRSASSRGPGRGQSRSRNRRGARTSFGTREGARDDGHVRDTAERTRKNRVIELHRDSGSAHSIRACSLGDSMISSLRSSLVDRGRRLVLAGPAVLRVSEPRGGIQPTRTAGLWVVFKRP
jgi:hypothetical protein